MSEANESFLIDLAKQFKIAQNLSASEHIRLLKNLEKLDEEKLVLILNYFITLETNIEVLTYLVKLAGKYQNQLTLDILSDMLLTDKFEKNELTTKLKCEIVTTLGRSENTNMVLPILYVLNNKTENYKIRLACADALGKIGSSYAVTPLIDVVMDNEEKSMYLRESAAKALGMLGDIRAIEPLANILESRNGLFDKFTFLKERIIETLGRLGQYGDYTSIRALKNALEDESEYVRISAIEALSEIDDDRVIPIIEKMLDDENEEVAKAAVFSLYEIMGTEYIENLLNKENLQECCKEEINDILYGSDEEIEANNDDY